MALDVTPPATRLDVLLVVDNSMSMAEEQAELSATFPSLIRSLLDPPPDPVTGLREHVALHDVHVGVVSTDMGTGGYSVETCSDPIDGDNGELQHAPNPGLPDCDPAYPTYLSNSGEHDRESIDWLSTAFGCIATLGIDGCGFEQQLKAAAKALIDHREGANAGFLRDDSILVVLFVTDEEDCSVHPGDEGIFDTLDSSLGHLCCRCFHHPYMIEPVETYVEAFRSLRADPERLLLAFLVGVPPGEECEGAGSEITGCLDHPDMQERIDPISMTRLVPSCVTRTGEAYPARRFVEIAQTFGDRTLVRSICTADFAPAIEDLADMLHERIDGSGPVTPLPMDKSTSRPGICSASCTLVETLSDMRSCPDGRSCHHDSHGAGCEIVLGEDGLPHTLCDVPQVVTRLADPDLDCEDPGAVLVPGSGQGWVYLPRSASGPRVFFTEGLAPGPGSTLSLSCCF